MSESAFDIQVSVVLVAVTCSNCGGAFGVPEHFNRSRRLDHKSFYCPSGHSQYFPQETEAEQLRKQLETQRSATEYQRSQKERAERRGSYLKGQVTKIKNRVANGVCPCCKRTFSNVARHMDTQHPDYKTQDIT